MSVNNPKIICLNGPPDSGRKEGADYLEKEFELNVIAIADPIYRLVSDIYRISRQDLIVHEDVPHEKLHGKTGREALTYWGETIKPFHGHSFWINRAIDDIKTMAKLDHRHFLISDLGFSVELDRLTAEFGGENLLVIQNYPKKEDWHPESDGGGIVKAFRDGGSFPNDPRGYVAPWREAWSGKARSTAIGVYREGTTGEYESRLKRVVGDWLDGKEL